MFIFSLTNKVKLFIERKKVLSGFCILTGARICRSKRRRENEGESVMQEPSTTVIQGLNTKVKEGPSSTGTEALSYDNDQYIKKSKKHKTR